MNQSAISKIERYQIIKLYLIQYTGIGEKQAEHDASLLETIVSHEAVEKISVLITGRCIQTCPKNAIISKRRPHDS
jgi:Mn-dependent DtxR family transcriptional regulator